METAGFSRAEPCAYSAPAHAAGGLLLHLRVPSVAEREPSGSQGRAAASPAARLAPSLGRPRIAGLRGLEAGALFVSLHSGRGHQAETSPNTNMSRG